MYDFQVLSSESELSELDTSLALRCEFERPNLNRFSRACISPTGSSPIICDFPATGDLVIIALTRGWGSTRDFETRANGDITRIQYIWRRDQTPEEGYFSCHNFRTDTNDPAGLYILYPSEWSSLLTLIERDVLYYIIPLLLQSLK